MRACETCGAVPPAGASFCGQCGTRLASALQQQTVAALRRSERKIVTILFADIKGSLALVAGQDPERAGEILGVVVACMSEAVRRHGGLVNQIMGDGIMALFGAPIAIEDHAAQACLAALSMRVAIQDQVRPRVSLRVGLGSGEVVVRAVTGDVALHYSAAGEAVHLASRMEQSAGPDQILITDETRGLAGGVIEVASRPDVVIKGMDGQAAVWELVGTRHGGSGGANGGTRGGGPDVRRGRLMVGRDRELGQLRRARDLAIAGEGQAVRLVGEAGSGKSRLLREFTTTHLPDEWQFCQAEAVSHRRTSYGVVSDLLASLFALQPEDGPAQRREKVLAGLGMASATADAEAGATLTPLSALLHLHAEAPGWAALDAWERRERTIAATVQAFQRLSVRRPVAVAVEDAQWLDAESATSIQRLGATAAGRRLLAVVTQRVAGPSLGHSLGSSLGHSLGHNLGSSLGHGMGRGGERGAGRGPGEDGTHWGDAGWTECAVQPLDETATVVFLRSRLLPGHDVAALERKLIAHTSGNPLFLEECLQALLDSGDLVRVGDMVRLERSVGELRVPSSLRGLLDARVDRLADAEKDVLQAAAVVGSTVPMDLLAGAAGLETGALSVALSRLTDAGFLVQGGAQPAGAEHAGARGQVAFRHGLIREAAYNTILKRTRVRMHGAVLDALERRPGPQEPIVDLLADHAMHAERWPKAADYAARAAARAYGRYANPEAVHYFDSALLAAAALPEGPLRDETLLKLRIGIRYPLFRLGRVAALGPHLDEAVRLAGLKSGYEEVAEALVLRSHVHWLRGEPDGALADAAAVASLAEQHGDKDLAIRARFQRGLVGLSQSDGPATLADMAAVIAHRATPGRSPGRLPGRPASGPAARPGRYGLDDKLLVNAHSYAARAQAGAGDVAAARRDCDAALLLAASIGERQTQIYAHLADSVVSLAEGRPDRAVAAAAAADELCRGADVRLLSPVAAGCLAQAYVAAGQAATALPIARQAVEDAGRMGFMALQPYRMLIVAETLVALDRVTEAEEAAHAALALARTQAEPGAEAGALALLAMALIRRGSPGEAAPLLTEARGIAERLGLKPLLRSLDGKGRFAGVWRARGAPSAL